MTPPRSLGRYAPAVRLRRALPAHRLRDKQMPLEAGKAKKGCGVAVFHRLRPPDEYHENDAQISGGETRCGLKIPGVSPWWLPRAPPHSCLSVYRCHSAVMAAVSHSTPETRFRVGSSLRMDCMHEPPVQSDYHARSGNYQLESNPERHDKSPVAVAIGNWVHGAEIVENAYRVLEVKA